MIDLNLENMAKLGQKIELISQKIGSLAKDGTNYFSEYDYISNEQMVTALRNESLENKLSIFPSIVGHEERDFENDKGKMVIRTTVSMSFKVVDLETGYFETMPFIGAEQDTGGKSFQQAVTQCTKYFYFKLFNVTSQDETDPDGVTTPAKKKKTGNAPKNNPDKVWLTEEQFNTALNSDAKGIKATLEHYSTDTHGMKKVWRDQLNEKLKSL